MYYSYILNHGFSGGTANRRENGSAEGRGGGGMTSLGPMLGKQFVRSMELDHDRVQYLGLAALKPVGSKQISISRKTRIQIDSYRHRYNPRKLPPRNQVAGDFV